MCSKKFESKIGVLSSSTIDFRRCFHIRIYIDLHIPVFLVLDKMILDELSSSEKISDSKLLIYFWRLRIYRKQTDCFAMWSRIQLDLTRELVNDNGSKLHRIMKYCPQVQYVWNDTNINIRSFRSVAKTFLKIMSFETLTTVFWRWLNWVYRDFY